MEKLEPADINKEIPGQTGEADLVVMAGLARGVPRHGIIVETGCLYGRSAYVWARNSDPTVKVFCIDPWERERWIIELVERPQKVSRPFGIDAFRHYTRDCSNIIEIKGRSPNAVEGVWKVPIDVYFDDSDHSDPGLSRNYNFWIPFVKPGGVVAGDDYGEHAPDVIRFADNLAKQWNQPLKRSVYLWWLFKPLAS